MSSYDVVIGLGQTGLSCAKYLLAQGKQIAITDSRVNPPGIDEIKALQIPCVFGEFSRELIFNAERLIISPGVSLKEPVIAEAIQKGISYLGDVELFALAVNKHIPIIAITGANGKSTVTTMVGEMAKQAGKKVIVAGNIGIPVLDCLQESAELYVLELSSFQLETTYSLNLTAATILNLSENHMDRYESMQDYAAAKQRIYQHAQTMIFNRDDHYTIPKNPGKKISFGISLPTNENDYGLMQINDETWVVKGQQKIISEKELNLKGGHNVLNAMAALALGEAVNLPLNAMQAALKQFQGLRHRCQFVLKKEGVSWYNDSKATTVVATSVALNTLANGKKNIIVILGGVGKEQDFSAITSALEKNAKHVLLIGKDAKIIAEHCGKVPYTFCQNLAEVIERAKTLAQSGDIVLLSPACASYDMFKHFEERGDVFIELVEKIIENK